MTSLMIAVARRVVCDALRASPEPLQVLADRLDVNKSTLWRVLNDSEYTPTPEMIERLLDGLGYEVDVVITRR